MTLRKLELSSGLITAALAVLILFMLIREDQQAAELLKRDFPLYRSVLVGSLLFVLPGSLVLVGAYVHSVKEKSFGQLPLMIGALMNIVVFLLFFFALAFRRLDFSFLVNFLLPVFAILTSVISVLVQIRKER
jgi:hypothetical protein